MRHASRSEHSVANVYCNKQTFYYFVKISTRIAVFNSHINQFNEHANCLDPLPTHTHTHTSDCDLITNLNMLYWSHW